MPQYTLFIKIEGRWKNFMTYKTDDPTEAFRIAMVALPSCHYDKQIRLESEDLTPPPARDRRTQERRERPHRGNREKR